jgi:hypothetical protein
MACAPTRAHAAQQEAANVCVGTARGGATQQCLAHGCRSISRGGALASTTSPARRLPQRPRPPALQFDSDQILDLRDTRRAPGRALGLLALGP